MTDEELQEIKNRAEAATKGPWLRASSWLSVDGTDGRTVAYTQDYADSSPDQRRADASFIAHARTDIPRLLTEVEGLRAELSATQQVTERQRQRAKAAERERDAHRARVEELEKELVDCKANSDNWQKTAFIMERALRKCSRTSAIASLLEEHGQLRDIDCRMNDQLTPCLCGECLRARGVMP